MENILLYLGTFIAAGYLLYKIGYFILDRSNQVSQTMTLRITGAEHIPPDAYADQYSNDSYDQFMLEVEINGHREKVSVSRPAYMKAVKTGAITLDVKVGRFSRKMIMYSPC